jgi:D-alanyl-D-alanine carboxypeptidase
MLPCGCQNRHAVLCEVFETVRRVGANHVRDDMMRLSLKAGAVALGLAISANLAIATSAIANPTIIVDADTGEVLHAKDATRAWYPASTTKMMTAYMLLKAVKEGRVSLDTPFVASKRAAGQKPSKAGIRPGQTVTADNALKIMMVKSANDIAVVIAENLSGSVENFVAEMNAESRRLGMNETRWANANGWHDPNQFTSARDLAILARVLWFQYPEARGYWGIGSVSLNGKLLKNTNGLVGRYPGVLGMKTGYVCASGFNLVSMARRGGQTLISVVLGADSGAERVVASARLLDEGFAKGGFFSSGGTGYSLASLPRQNAGPAPNLRGTVCRAGRPPFSLTEEESDRPVAYSTTGSQAQSPLEALLAQKRVAAQSANVRASGNVLTLGERVLGAPILVAFGGATKQRLPKVKQQGDETIEPAADNAGEPLPGFEGDGQAVRPAQQAAIAARIVEPGPAALPIEDLRTLEAGQAGEPLMLTGAEPSLAERATIQPKAKPKTAAAKKDAVPAKGGAKAKPPVKKKRVKKAPEG